MSEISGVNGFLGGFMNSVYQAQAGASNTASTAAGMSMDISGSVSLFAVALGQTMQQMGIGNQQTNPQTTNPQGQNPQNPQESLSNFLGSLFSTLSNISTSGLSTSSNIPSSSNPLLGALNTLVQDLQSGSGLSMSSVSSLESSFSNFLATFSQNPLNSTLNSASSNTSADNITLQAFLQTLSQNLTNDLFGNNQNMLSQDV